MGHLHVHYSSICEILNSDSRYIAYRVAVITPNLSFQIK